MAEDKAAKMALMERRRQTRKESVRSLARFYGTTVPAIHKSAGCGENCTGPGCRV